MSFYQCIWSCGITLSDDGIFVLTEVCKIPLNSSFSFLTCLLASSFTSLIFETRLRMSMCSLSMSDLCISCDSVVNGRHHAVSCDVCECWQHYLCGTD